MLAGMLNPRPGFLIHILVSAGLVACGPKEGAGTDSAGTGDVEASGTLAPGSTGPVVTTGEPGTGTASTGDPSAVTGEPTTGDSCGGGGCNPAPVCGEPCICCCGCAPGESQCEVVDGAAVVMRCAADGGCFEPEACGEGQRCVFEGGAASCSGGPVSCAAIEADYAALVDDPASRGCNDVVECKVVFGHCGVGLGGCYHALAQDFDEGQLAALAMVYTDNKCTQGVCDCAEAPPLQCVDNLCGFVP